MSYPEDNYYKIEKKLSLQNNLKKLKDYKEWTGKQYDDGIWGDINRVNTILKEDYGITII